MTFVFPTALIIQSVCAAGVYAAYGNVRMAIYWLAAATLNAAVTY